MQINGLWAGEISRIRRSAETSLRTPDLAPQIRGAGENRPAQNWRLKGLRRVMPGGKLGHAAASVASFPRWSDPHQRGPRVPTTGRAGGVLPRADAGVSAWRERSEKFPDVHESVDRQWDGAAAGYRAGVRSAAGDS